MKQELQQKLFEAAPLLYRDRTKPMNQTCMCWGIECGDGWFNLLMEASVALEKEIEELVEKYPVHSMTKCRACGCLQKAHQEHHDGTLPCNRIHYIPYRFGGWLGGYLSFCWFNIKNHIKTWYGIKYLFKQMILRRIRSTFYNRVNRISRWLFDIFNIGYYKPCFCKDFDPPYPRASQVKEKYGTLRFHLDGWTDKMSEIIEEAENKSEVTCENCGQPGTLRMEGWHFTFCDTCETLRQEKGCAPWLR